MFKKLIQFFMGEPEGHISEIDKFMAKQQFNLSQSQCAEIAQHQRIVAKRD